MERRGFIKGLLATLGGVATASVITPELTLEEFLVKETDESVVRNLSEQEGEDRFYSLPKDNIFYNPAQVASIRFPDIMVQLSDHNKILNRHGVSLDDLRKEPATESELRRQRFALERLGDVQRPFVVNRHGDAGLFVAYWGGRLVGEISDKDIVANAGAWDAWIDSLSRGILLGESSAPSILSPSLYGRSLLVNMRSIRASRDEKREKDWIDEYNSGVIKNGKLFNV